MLVDQMVYHLVGKLDAMLVDLMDELLVDYLVYQKVGKLVEWRAVQ